MSSVASPWAGVELLERAVGYARVSLTAVTPDLLDAPTPCAGWDLRALLVHLDDSLASLQEAGAVRRVRLTMPAAPDDLVGSLRGRASGLLADWSRNEHRGHVAVDDRPLSAQVLTSAGALEVAVHGWDIATACGRPRPLPDDLARDLLRVAGVLVTDADRPTRFGSPVPCPPEAAPSARLLCFLGRQPG